MASLNVLDRSGKSVRLWMEESLVQDSLGHCVISFGMTLYPLLSTGSTKEDRKHSDMTEKS